MTGRFDARVVVVTGASRGIGAATAKAFASEGAHVVVNYRSDGAGAGATVDSITDAGGVATPLQADVGDPKETEQLVAETENRAGPIDVLVNNAAAFDRNSFLEVGLDDLERLWATNVRGLFHLSQLVARTMVERGSGSIIHVSSILARLAVPSRTAYCATKGAVESLTRSMALDLAGTGVRVNAVAPGLISTEALLAGMPDPDLQTEIQRYVPGGRFGDPDEIARVVTFLASADADYINGSVIPVDAGLGGREAGPPG